MKPPADFGDWPAERRALGETAGVLDLSFRSRICLVGNDRVRFLHGQVTNDVKKLGLGEGCYAAIVTAKGRMESDVNIFNLPDELLLDFEPGLSAKISARLEKFIVADDVRVVDAAPDYGLLSVQGPKAGEVLRRLGIFPQIPDKRFGSVKISDPECGEIVLADNPRAGLPGFDLFVPNQSLGALRDMSVMAAAKCGGRAVGWTAFETARIEAGIPRFGADMDETNLPLECGIEDRAVSYHKGCYIGQEVINRIHSIGHVNRELRGLRLADSLKTLPRRGDKLFHGGKEAGHITSAARSPALNANIALGYVRRDAFQTGSQLTLRSEAGENLAEVVELPFGK